MKRALLLDRDGVINYDSSSYIKNCEEFVFIPGSLAAIARLTQAGYIIGIATNQSGVSRGLYTEADLNLIHEKLIKAVIEAGGYIASIEYCIHLPETACSCRKPNPGMLHALAEKLNISLATVPFVGDRISDIKAAQAVGARPVIVLSSMTDRMLLADYPGVPVYNSLKDYVDALLLHYEPCY